MKYAVSIFKYFIKYFIKSNIYIIKYVLFLIIFSQLSGCKVKNSEQAADKVDSKNEIAKIVEQKPLRKDTMPNNQLKTFGPPYYENGKTYFQNFTVHLSDTNIQNPYEDIKVFVKTAEQDPVGWIWPLKDSEMFKDDIINLLEVQNSGSTFLYSIIHFENEIHNSSENIIEDLSIHMRQDGIFLIFQISHKRVTYSSRLASATTEILVYDLKGNLFVSKVRDGVNSRAGMSQNGKYLFETFGGVLSEDIRVPYSCLIYDIKNNKYLWKAKSETDIVGGGPRDDSDWTTLRIIIDENHANKNNSAFLFNTTTDKLYEFISRNKCNASDIKIRKNQIFYNTREKKNIPLSINDDFKIIDSFPSINTEESIDKPSSHEK